MNPSEFDESNAENGETLSENKYERALSWRLLNSASELAATLNNHSPSLSYDEFSFYDDRLSQAKLPDYIEASILTRRLDEIQVDLTYRHDMSHADIAIRFFIIDEDGQKIIMQFDSPRFGETEYHCFTLHLSKDSANETRTIPASEVNQCLASLIYPSDDADFSKFSDLNMQSDVVAADLLSSFDMHASSHLSEREYAVELPDTTKGSIRCCFQNSDLFLTEISRIVNERFGVDDDGSLVDDIRRITTQIQLGDGKEIGGVSFYEEEGSKPSVEFESTHDDYLLTLTFVESLIEKYRSDTDEVHFSDLEDDYTTHPSYDDTYDDKDE